MLQYSRWKRFRELCFSFPRFSVTCLCGKKLIDVTFAGHQRGQERAWIKSHPPSGNGVFLQTQTGNSHVKYSRTVILTMGDRTAVFARKIPLTKQWKLLFIFQKLVLGIIKIQQARCARLVEPNNALELRTWLSPQFSSAQSQAGYYL